MSTETTTPTDTDVLPYEDDTTGDIRAHIVRPEENGQQYDLTGQDIVDLARLNGTEVVALCGHRFVPSHDPAPAPACEPCVDVAAQIMKGERY